MADHQRTFRIRQFRRVAQSTPIRRTPKLCRPRHFLPHANCPQDQRTTSASADSILFWMGSQTKTTVVYAPARVGMLPDVHACSPPLWSSEQGVKPQLRMMSSNASGSTPLTL